MTLRDLIDQLEDAAQSFGDDIEVRLAHQPRWAFEYSIANVVVLERTVEDGADPEPAVVYIGEGNQLGYLPGDAAAELGWPS